MTTSKTIPFSIHEQKAIADLVAQIIPASQEFDQPGADDPAILHDILTSGAYLRDRLAAALTRVSVDTFVDAAWAADFRRAYPAEAELLQTLTVQCYYRDERVMRSLKIEVRPPFPVGYIQQPNDFSLLEPVRKRGEIYRKVP
jgi:hypothetical protein